MTIQQLDYNLEQALTDFSVEMHALYADESKVPVTEGDISALARQTFNLVDTFRG